jgi:hypothetical protein
VTWWITISELQNHHLCIWTASPWWEEALCAINFNFASVQRLVPILISLTASTQFLLFFPRSLKFMFDTCSNQWNTPFYRMNLKDSVISSPLGHGASRPVARKKEEKRKKRRRKRPRGGRSRRMWAAAEWGPQSEGRCAWARYAFPFFLFYLNSSCIWMRLVYLVAYAPLTHNPDNRVPPVRLQSLGLQQLISIRIRAN